MCRIFMPYPCREWHTPSSNGSQVTTFKWNILYRFKATVIVEGLQWNSEKSCIKICYLFQRSMNWAYRRDKIVIFTYFINKKRIWKCSHWQFLNVTRRDNRIPAETCVDYMNYTGVEGAAKLSLRAGARKASLTISSWEIQHY